jgi:hypothetical protein
VGANAALTWFESLASSSEAAPSCVAMAVPVKLPPSPGRSVRVFEGGLNFSVAHFFGSCQRCSRSR